MDALMNLRPDRRLESWTQAHAPGHVPTIRPPIYDRERPQVDHHLGMAELSDYASPYGPGLHATTTPPAGRPGLKPPDGTQLLSRHMATDVAFIAVSASPPCRSPDLIAEQEIF